MDSDKKLCIPKLEQRILDLSTITFIRKNKFSIYTYVYGLQ